MINDRIIFQSHSIDFKNYFIVSVILKTIPNIGFGLVHKPILLKTAFL